MTRDLGTLPTTTASTPIKLYTDASYNERNNYSTAGWCLRTHTGRFLAKYSEDLGTGYQSVSAEVEAAERALRYIADYCSPEHVKLYCDCQPALHKINTERFEDKFESLTVEWVPRAENVVADMAATDQQQTNTLAMMKSHGKTPTEPETEAVETPKFGICD